MESVTPVTWGADGNCSVSDAPVGVEYPAQLVNAFGVSPPV
jgi:hypothetical protein